MAEMTKHVGMISNTGKRCAIIFLQIPGKEDHTLVVDTEALPERIHDPLMDIIRSSESQQAQNLGEVLARRIMPDSGRTILEELHLTGYLQRQPVNNVMVVPRPSVRVNLMEMLEAMGRLDKNRLSQGVVDPRTTQETQLTEDVTTTETLVNDVAESVTATISEDVFSVNKEVSETEGDMEVAKGLLTQAELLEADATGMREKAYNMFPSLRPVEKSTTKSTTTKPKTTTRTATKKDTKSESKTTGTRAKNTGRKSSTA